MRDYPCRRRRWRFDDGDGGSFPCRRRVFLYRKSVSDEDVEAGEEWPRTLVTAVGFGNPSFLDLIFLFKRVDSVLALNVGSTSFLVVTGGVEVVDGVGNLLPVLLAEVTAVKV